MKLPTVQIHDAKPSKKNPNAKYIVKSVSRNGEILQSSEALNDYKAVKTHIKAMNDVWNYDEYVSRAVTDCTKEQLFSKRNYALPKPEQKK